jgi:hypothetical protein
MPDALLLVKGPRLKITHTINISLMKERFGVTDKIRQNRTPALRDSVVKNTPCANTKNTSHYIFVKNMTCLSVGLLKICQAFLSSLKLCIHGLRQIAVS